MAKLSLEDSPRMNDTAAVYRFCNSACVSVNLQLQLQGGRRCDVVDYTPTWKSCYLWQWAEHTDPDQVVKRRKIINPYNRQIMIRRV